MPDVKRHVIGIKKDKKSGVILSDNPNHQETPRIFWRSTLWNTTELPVDGAPCPRCDGSAKLVQGIGGG